MLRTTPGLHLVPANDVDPLDLAVVAHANAAEDGLGGREAMRRAFTAAGVLDLAAQIDDLTGLLDERHRAAVDAQAALERVAVA